MATKILVVDDDLHCVAIVRMSLEPRGYRLSEAHNGIEALQCVLDDRPDLILLDVTMPKLDGHKVLGVLKSEPNTEQIPVVMFTALEGDAARTRASEIGTDLYFRKPFIPGELVSYIELILNRGNGVTQSPSTLPAEAAVS